MTTKKELKEIITSHSWIKVKRFDESQYDNCVDGLDGLEKHHVEETEFLIKKCRLLAMELLEKNEKYYIDSTSGTHSHTW
jgi:hypothetical protein